MACLGARSTLRFALLAYYGHTKMRLTPFAGDDPGPSYPRRIVAHMPRVAAFELCDPIVLFVLQESNNLSVKHFLMPGDAGLGSRAHKSLRQTKRKQRRPCGHRYVLLSVHRVRHRRGINRGAALKMPQRFPARCVQRDKISFRIARKHHSARG
jgi:hypothetical protein